MTDPLNPMPIDDLASQEAIDALMQLIAEKEQSTSPIEVPEFEDKFQEYSGQLRGILQPRPKTSPYELASTLGAAMLASPRDNPFTAAGKGFATFSAEEKKRKEQRLAEDRQIALKAADLARSDVKQAQNLLNQYDLLRAKQDASSSMTEYQVKRGGIKVRGQNYNIGDKVFLTDPEAFAVRRNIGSPGDVGYKTSATGALAVYQSREDAENTIESLGLPRTSPNFNRAVEQITAKTDAAIGRPVISGGAYAEFNSVVLNDQVTNVTIGPSANAQTPAYTRYVEKRLDNIAKNDENFNSIRSQSIPAAEEAMRLLLDEPDMETGKLSELALPFRQIAIQILGTDDPMVSKLERLESIAFYLAPKMRPVGSGSTSDMEFNAYKKAILSLGNTPEANYLALYMFKKMAEKGFALNERETELLTDTSITSKKQLNEQLFKDDEGILAKYEGDINDKQEFDAWYNSLERGTVIDNSEKIFNADSSYIIKGWNR
tara:strand:- start:3294 stop:4760 length:1467 start_codon:yes stop_codon:yes gene_type:complete